MGEPWRDVESATVLCTELNAVPATKRWGVVAEIDRNVEDRPAHAAHELGLAVGLGLGGPGILAALFHTLNHALCKPMAFFAAGRLGQMYGTHDTARLSGCLRGAPVWGRALFGSLLAVIGVAPFAVFMSEFMILRAAARNGAWWTLGIFLAGLAVVFIGVLRQAVNMAWGEPVAVPKEERAGTMDRVLIVGALGALLVLGVWFPEVLSGMLDRASNIVEGTQ